MQRVCKNGKRPERSEWRALILKLLTECEATYHTLRSLEQLKLMADIWTDDLWNDLQWDGAMPALIRAVQEHRRESARFPLPVDILTRLLALRPAPVPQEEAAAWNATNIHYADLIRRALRNDQRARLELENLTPTTGQIH